MATNDPKNSISINGKKYRSYQKQDGSWTDPLVEHTFYSRTFMPLATKYIEGEEISEMITQIKLDPTIVFKEEELSEDTKVELDKENIVYEKEISEIIKVK